MKIRLLQFIAPIVYLALFITMQNVQPDVILAANQINETDSIPANVMGKIDPVVLSEINSQDTTDFFIWLAGQADISGARQLATKLEKGEYVFDTLTNFADQSQKDLHTFLTAKGVDYRPFYIANTILVRAGSRDLLMDIAARPDVEAIFPNREYQLQEPFVDDPDPPETLAVEPNLTFIRATDVWAMGITGEGAVLAGADTGLQWDHPAIIEHYRGWDGSSADHNYNWWDATGEYPIVPTDGHGHGTHVSGIMVGDDGGFNQIGVAPGAKTIHCKLLTDSGYSNDEIIMECFAWILAPWDLNGEDPLPSMAPHAMNNSWGYTGGGNPVFEAIISNLNAAGILVEASAGGSGPSCATLVSPGDYLQVLTTGSVNHLGGELPGILSPFSARGPSMLYPDAFKPNIIAPGHNIRSSIPGNAYEIWSGTSMAGPHATALLGLMWSACPAYQGLVEDTFEIIHSTAVPLTGQGGSNCGGDYEAGPNNDWGYGTIDALAAVNEILSLCGPQGYLEGYVIDSTDLTPITGATVNADWQDGGSWEKTTADDGYYLFEIPTGLYDVTAEHPHYTSAMAMDVEVFEDTITIQDFSLQAKGLLWGYVTDYDNALPLEGVMVTADDGTWAETDTYGYYEIYLDEGTYDITATLQDYAPHEVTVNIISGEETQQDFALVAAVAFIPTPLHVTVPWQNEYSQEVELINRLPWDYDFEFVELPDSDVPWFDQDPLEGTVPAEDSIFPLMLFSATYDAGVNQPGDYTCTLSIVGDPPLYVPVTMTVPQPDSMGQLHGTILDNCTGEPLMADIYIEDGDPVTETQSDENSGYYSVWLYPGEYQLTISADDYLDFVVTVTIVAQEAVELDVNLVPERPCASAYPDEIEVWVPYGMELYQHPTGLAIINNGGADLEFTLWELADLPLTADGDGISSLSGSIVTFDPSVGGDETYIPGTTQTFCFEAKSHSPDWEYALSVWQKFPSDWEISDVYVQSTPSCTSGGSFGTFSWFFHTSPYEVRINHPRYHASGGDTCTAYYCFEVSSAPAGIEAPVSWYWNGNNWGSPPYNPCSDDNYTPSGQPACDEAINPVAGVPIGAMDVPWFWQDPESGLVPPVYTSNVDILFTALNEDSDPMPTGEYSAALIVVHNDPFKGTIHIPVTMHVVLPEYGVELAPEDDAQSGDPGATVAYTLTLTNTGNAIDTFEITIEGNEWQVHLPEDSFTLSAGESAEVIVHVTIPSDTLVGEHDSVVITATSQGDENETASSTLTTTANAVYGLTLEPVADALSGDPGETVEYTLTLTNSGNAPDTITLEAGESEWLVQLPESSFDLAAGASVDVIVHVTIPAEAEDGDLDVVSITATSMGDEQVAVSSTLTTTAVVPEPDWFFLYTPLVAKN